MHESETQLMKVIESMQKNNPEGLPVNGNDTIADVTGKQIRPQRELCDYWKSNGGEQA